MLIAGATVHRLTSFIKETSTIGDPLKITTIICDDHPAFASGVAALLQAEADDIEIVGVAGSGEQAEHLVVDLLPDIVLMDVRMPGAGGIEVTRRIQAASPTTKVVMLTVSDETSDLYASLRAGASGYVLKDKEVWEIADAVRSVHRGHLIIPAGLAGRFVEDLDQADSTALSDQEREILAAIARGETNREIAARMSLSERTVKRRVEDIYSKLHLADRLEAAVYAATRGLGNEAGRR